jgi:bacteriorhodopsin
MANLAERNADLDEIETNKKTVIQDYLIIIAGYIVFYSFLIGFTLVLLLGAIKTSNEGTVLWSFFFSGVLFYMMVATAICLVSRNNQSKMEEEEENITDNLQVSEV